MNKNKKLKPGDLFLIKNDGRIMNVLHNTVGLYLYEDDVDGIHLTYNIYWFYSFSGKKNILSSQTL